MELGAFSVSLAVKDIVASRIFYEKLGFVAIMGEEAQNWLIMKNGDHVIGLFQGMFDRNILTFNPGWNANSETCRISPIFGRSRRRSVPAESTRGRKSTRNRPDRRTSRSPIRTAMSSCSISTYD